jgi:hypothetical protein
MSRVSLLILLLFPIYSLAQTSHTERYVTGINNCDLPVVSKNCVLITNGDSSNIVGRAVIISQFREILTFLKNPKITISDELGNAKQEMAHWKLKDGDSIINQGSMMIKINNDSISSISLFYDYIKPTGYTSAPLRSL